jgi:hypothetical protein
MTDDRAIARDAEDDDAPHVLDDLAAAQGRSDDPDAIPVEDVMTLGAIRDPELQGSAVLDVSEVDTLGEITDTRIYEGELEARTPGSDQPDESDAENLESLLETELREGETDDAGEAAEEGLTWVPPSDPPIVANERGDAEVAAGFGTTADDEPFDADHHASGLFGEDEMTQRVLDALRTHAETAGLADRLQVETIGPRVVVAGEVDDLDDEDAVLGVVSDVDGVVDVESRIEVVAAS